MITRLPDFAACSANLAAPPQERVMYDTTELVLLSSQWFRQLIAKHFGIGSMLSWYIVSAQSWYYYTGRYSAPVVNTPIQLHKGYLYTVPQAPEGQTNQHCQTNLHYLM